jgi:hypothetical protein
MVRELENASSHLKNGRFCLSNALNELGTLLVNNGDEIKDIYDRLFDLVCEVSRIEINVNKYNE